MYTSEVDRFLISSFNRPNFLRELKWDIGYDPQSQRDYAIKLPVRLHSYYPELQYSDHSETHRMDGVRMVIQCASQKFVSKIAYWVFKTARY